MSDTIRTASTSSGKSSGGGKGSKKFGRHGRSGSMKSYISLNREATNKARKAAKQKKANAKKSSRVTTPRGTQRAFRRANMVVFNAAREAQKKELRRLQLEH